MSHRIRLLQHTDMLINGRTGDVLCVKNFKLKLMINRILSISVVFILLGPSVSADTCPSAIDIRNRKVPEAYEWTVNYELALDDLLSVTKLYAVTIENHGAFVSCKYESPRREVKLDGISKTKKCLITVSTGDWFTMDNGKIICRDDDIRRCQYKFEC